MSSAHIVQILLERVLTCVAASKGPSPNVGVGRSGCRGKSDRRPAPRSPAGLSALVPGEIQRQAKAAQCSGRRQERGVKRIDVGRVWGRGPGRGWRTLGDGGRRSWFPVPGSQFPVPDARFRGTGASPLLAALRRAAWSTGEAPAGWLPGSAGPLLRGQEGRCRWAGRRAWPNSRARVRARSQDGPRRQGSHSRGRGDLAPEAFTGLEQCC
jgi:hypothetical protein